MTHITICLRYVVCLVFYKTRWNILICESSPPLFLTWTFWELLKLLESILRRRSAYQGKVGRIHSMNGIMMSKVILTLSNETVFCHSIIVILCIILQMFLCTYVSQEWLPSSIFQKISLTFYSQTILIMSILIYSSRGAYITATQKNSPPPEFFSCFDFFGKVIYIPVFKAPYAITNGIISTLMSSAVDPLGSGLQKIVGTSYKSRQI